MKLKLLLSASLFYSISLLAQNSNDKITYLDSLFKPTTEANYKYKQVVKDHNLDQELYDIKTYYKSGTLKSHGTSLNKDYIMFIGTTKNYFENGQLESISTTQGILTHPKKEFNWYDNGKKKSETECSLDPKDNRHISRVIQFWDKEGNQQIKDGNGIYEEIEGSTYYKGPFKNGYEHGVWSGSDKEYNFTFTETYKKGRLVSGTSIDSENKEYHYKEIDQWPVLKKKSNVSLEEFIDKEMPSFNPKSKFFDVKNKVIITIGKNGKLTKVETIPDINNEIPQLIQKIFEQYGDWTPFKYRGIPIPYTQTFHPKGNLTMIVTE